MTDAPLTPDERRPHPTILDEPLTTEERESLRQRVEPDRVELYYPFLTARLLAEHDRLRAENERLRAALDGVLGDLTTVAKSVDGEVLAPYRPREESVVLRVRAALARVTAPGSPQTPTPRPEGGTVGVSRFAQCMGVLLNPGPDVYWYRCAFCGLKMSATTEPTNGLRCCRRCHAPFPWVRFTHEIHVYPREARVTVLSWLAHQTPITSAPGSPQT